MSSAERLPPAGTGTRSASSDRFGPRARPILAYGLAAIFLVGGTGVGMGAWTLQPGPGETGAGSADPTASPAHWSVASVGTATTGLLVPGSISHAAGAPSKLPKTNRGWRLDAATAGDAGLKWRFVESPGAIPATEWELTFVVSYSLSGVAATFSTQAYLVTQASSPGTPYVYMFLWDSGSPTGLVVDSEIEILQACPSIGGCP